METKIFSETQEGLNEVVVNRVRSTIDNNRLKVQSAYNLLLRESKESLDFISPLGKGGKICFSNEGKELKIQVQGSMFNLHNNALGQIALKLDIPPKYLKELVRGGHNWQSSLAKEILINHTENTPNSRVLVRTVNNQVRGVLSEQYKRLDSVALLTSFIEASHLQGGEIMNLIVSDTKLFCETIMPNPISIPTAKNGTVVIFIGARFSTSDYGDGAVEMRTFMLNGACLNGMVRESVMKQKHLGAKLAFDLAFSNETYRLDTQATASALKDLTNSLFDLPTIELRAQEIMAASSHDIDLEVELTTLVRTGGLFKSEKDKVQTILLNNNPNDGVQGAGTLWKLSQAITAHARELDPTRERELHEMSGRLFDRLKIN